MGMNYNVTFHNATIKPERYGELIDWAPEEVRAAGPRKAVRLALEAIQSRLDSYGDKPEQDADGIHLDGSGFYDSASYGYMDELWRLLRLCEPGAYLHDVDSEEGTGEQSRHVLLEGGKIKTITPTLVWPELVTA